MKPDWNLDEWDRWQDDLDFEAIARRRAQDDIDERRASPPDVMAGLGPDEDMGEPDEDLPGAETWPDIEEVA